MVLLATACQYNYVFAFMIVCVTSLVCVCAQTVILVNLNDPACYVTCYVYIAVCSLCSATAYACLCIQPCFCLQVVPPRNDSTLICYSVKIINPENKGGHLIEGNKLSSVDSMQSKLVELFGKCSNGAEFQLGYLTLGHGFKGKQLLLTSDEDIVKMYGEHQGRRSITLWIKIKQKRPNESSITPTPQAKKAKACESHLEKMDELQKIVDKLKEKHKEGPCSHFSST